MAGVGATHPRPAEPWPARRSGAQPAGYRPGRRVAPGHRRRACPRCERWAQAYLAQRGLARPATEALAGYAPSRPGHWTLLLDHLRDLGHGDTAIQTAGLAARSRRGELIDRFRDRIILPVLDEANRPIGFVGRKPAGDTNPDNPKYLNPTSTPLYDKSRVLYGLDAAAIEQLSAGAQAVIVEGPMDRLAIRLAAPDLVPIATCGTALTDAHLDLLAEHTSLDRVILSFDADPAGRKATVAAGRKLVDRGVASPYIELFTAPAGVDPAAILADDGPDHLAATLADPRHHGTLLDLLVDQQLNRYEGPDHDRSLRDLPISQHAAYEAARLVADTFRDQIGDPSAVAAHIQRQMARIVHPTGVDARTLNSYLLDVMIQPDHVEFGLPEVDQQDLKHDVALRTPELEDEIASDPDHEPGGL